jgi:predicted RNA-binding Zn-ribbon protein involved in translation (DUF1610 family)
MTVEELRESFERQIAKSLEKEHTDLKATGGKMASDSPEKARELGAQPIGSSIGVAVAPAEVEDYRLCPKCGSTLYRRSRRRWYERLVRRPKMARCLKCDHRFHYPH